MKIAPMNSRMLLGLVMKLLLVVPPASGDELVGLSVVPHRIDTGLKYLKPVPPQEIFDALLVLRVFEHRTQGPPPAHGPL